MRTTKKFILLLLIVCFVASPLCVMAQQQAADKQTLDNVRRSYSMLKHQGLIGLEAQVTPVWDYLMANSSQKQKAQVTRLMNQLRFSISIDSAGALKVNHRVVGPAPDEKTQQMLVEMAKSVELTTIGFLMSWAPVMLTYLIPDKLESFVLQDLGAEYLLSFKDQGFDISISMTKDLVIKEVKSSQNSLKPSFVRTSKGFLLTGYDAAFNDPSLGAGSISVTLVSQEVAGMQLPSRVTLNSTTQGMFGKVELLFTNYQLKTTASAAR